MKQATQFALYGTIAIIAERISYLIINFLIYKFLRKKFMSF